MQHKIKLIRRRLRNALGELNTIHAGALVKFQARDLDGGKMRNLDDAQQWLTDTLGALNEFLTFTDKGGA